MKAAQEVLFDDVGFEDDEFLKTQLITYLGNRLDVLDADGLALGPGQQGTAEYSGPLSQRSPAVCHATR